MNKNRIRAAAFSLLLALCIGAAGCSTPVTSAGGESASTSQVQVAEVSDEDTDASWDEASATRIELNGTSATVEGSGAEVNGNTITITAAGTYVVRGTLAEGQIHVDAGKEDLVRLVLDGVDITCTTGAPIYASGHRKLVVVLAEGSVNRLEDGETYAFVADEDEPDAALFAKNDLTINGTGSLTVVAHYNNGIGAKDDLLLVSGSITVEAANHGIRGRDSLTVLGGSYTVVAGNDGLQANNGNSGDVGWIDIQGGSFDITSGHDAVQTESSLTISGGEFILLAAGGANATAPATTSADDSTSYKGLKAGTDILITDGVFHIDTLDDAVHGNGNVTIEGGSFTISTGDDGVHADDDLRISGGTIDILQSYEGLEGATVLISGGDIRLVASDDGINAAGGSDSTGGGDIFGSDRFGGSVSEDWWIEITGGTVYVNAAGDGIDSNGVVRMSGGTLIIDGPTSGGDGAIDYELDFALTGGTLLAIGSRGMAETPTAESSTQPTLMVTWSEIQAAGTVIALQRAAGETLIEHTAAKSFQTAVISTPDMEDGDTVALLVDGVKAADITLAGMVTSVSDTGEAVAGGFGGGMPGFGMGGGRGQMDRGTAPEGFDPADMGELPEMPEGFEPGDMDGEPPALPDGDTGGFGGAGRGIAWGSVGALYA